MMANTIFYNIYIAGDIETITHTCREYCLCGLCVSITPTTFVFTGGSETGAIVGLLNYPRFPRAPVEIEEHAKALASKLLADCCQRSCTILCADTTYYLENPNINIPR